MVNEPMVPAAERNAVRDAGRAFVGPMYDMMNIAPAGWYSTPRESTPAIPEDHGAPDRRWHCIAGAPDVQWLTAGAQHHRNHLRVAGDAAGDVGVDRAAEGQRR